MISSPITSWQIDRGKMETVRDFIFLGSKVTADGDCSHEIKRCLLLEIKVTTNLDSILKKQRHYFVNKGPSSQGCGFSISHLWRWESDYNESWAPKNWTFELWCCRKLLRVPWPAWRSNQSILKEISPEYSLERLMLKLKLQYFDDLMRRTDLFEKTLMLRKMESAWRRPRQRMKWLDGNIDVMNMSLIRLRELLMDKEAWCAVVHGFTQSWTPLSDWSELKWYSYP